MGFKLILGSVLAFAVAASPQDGALDPGEWVHAGDSDGDGLSDDFETRHGLDPAKVETYSDGIADEHRLASATSTMWDLQKAEELQQPASFDSGGDGGGCGATGLEAFLLLVILSRSARNSISRRFVQTGPLEG